VYQIATGTCPAAFTNNTAGQKLLLPVAQGSGGVKALYFAVPGVVRCCCACPLLSWPGCELVLSSYTCS